MKILALILLSASCCFGQSAATNTVKFFFQDAFGRPQALRRFTLRPVPNLYPATNNLGEITGDFFGGVTDTNGNATVTNVTSGTYQRVMYGPTLNTTNYYQFPATTNTLNARDWVTLYPTGLGFILYEEGGVQGGRILFEP